MLLNYLLPLLITIAAYGHITTAFQCSYTTPDGRYVYNDLQQLDRTTDFTAFDGIFTYTMNVCGFSNNKNCSGVHGSICTLRDGMVIDAIGKYGAGPEPQWATTSASHPAMGVTLTFENGMFEGKKTTVRLNLICDLGALTTARNFSAIYTLDMFVLQLHTPYACPKINADAAAATPAATAAGQNPGAQSTETPSQDSNIIIPGASPASTPVSPSSTAPPSGISGGSLFVILVLLVISCYVGIGCFYKSQHLGTTGMESCPHYEFWQQVPKYVHDGCLFAYRKVSSFFQRGPSINRDEYDGL